MIKTRQNFIDLVSPVSRCTRHFSEWGLLRSYQRRTWNLCDGKLMHDWIARAKVEQNSVSKNGWERWGARHRQGQRLFITYGGNKIYYPLRRGRKFWPRQIFWSTYTVCIIYMTYILYICMYVYPYTQLGRWLIKCSYMSTDPRPRCMEFLPQSCFLLPSLSLEGPRLANTATKIAYMSAAVKTRVKIDRIMPFMSH